MPTERRPERRAKLSPTSETAQGGRRLVIVESPAKAKTIKGYLGPGYVVEASVGHIRDLPQPSELPAVLSLRSVTVQPAPVSNGKSPQRPLER